MVLPSSPRARRARPGHASVRRRAPSRRRTASPAHGIGRQRHHAVAQPGKGDVHQNEPWSVLSGQIEGFLGRSPEADHREAGLRKCTLGFQGNQEIVLNDQDGICVPAFPGSIPSRPLPPFPPGRSCCDDADTAVPISSCIISASHRGKANACPCRRPRHFEIGLELSSETHNETRPEEVRRRTASKSNPGPSSVETVQQTLPAGVKSCGRPRPAFCPTGGRATRALRHDRCKPVFGGPVPGRRRRNPSAGLFQNAPCFLAFSGPRRAERQGMHDLHVVLDSVVELVEQQTLLRLGLLTARSGPPAC